MHFLSAYPSLINLSPPYLILNSPNNDMLYFYMLKRRAEKIADQLGVIDALREDPGLVPSIHTRWLTTSCNISSRDPDAAS